MARKREQYPDRIKAARRRKKQYSGIGGQAVLEGVMMKNKEKYAVAVRKPSGEIAVEVENYQSVVHENGVSKIPFLRGVVNFIDSMILGTKVLNYSASFYEEDEENTALDKALDKISGGNGEKILTTLITVISVVLALGIFVVLPFLISNYFEGFVQNHSLLMIIEGGVRIAIFLAYVSLISLMKDIRRLYQYHGAEHKCINCIERGRELTVENVMRSSRYHKRCGTSFIFFVLVVSIILFFFIRVESIPLRVLLRLLLMPVVAGISYEFIRLAGKHDNPLVTVISAPGLLFQKITTKEPDEDMVEVAIASVNAVFDWREYLSETFGYTWEEEEE